MGRIKTTILSKKDRTVTDPKPPSMRKIKRMNKSSVESSRAGRNSTLTPSRMVGLRGLRRSGEVANDPKGTFTQIIPEVALFRFKKNKRPTKVVINEHYSDGKADKVTERRIKFETCSTDDGAAMARFEGMVKAGLGKLEIRKRKVIRHRVDKQDDNFKLHKHDVKF